MLAFLAWGWPSVFVVLYALLLAAAALFLLFAAVKWFREMVAIDRETSGR